mmetsp:Transcript_15450/g.36915  ORF Transcript_15450/g.36915 Transcript_15450/m.36915 type:complete len:97 (-) Transcript_15450:437-727(-)
MHFTSSVSLVILAATTCEAFVPTTQRNLVGAEKSSTAVGPGFLKDLGFEKPSWLPDFGGEDKKEDSPKAEATDGEADAEDSEESTADTGEEAEAAP